MTDLEKATSEEQPSYVATVTSSDTDSTKIVSDAAPTPRVLCVDLDGTLCASDILVESIFHLLRYQPGAIISLIRAFTKGKAPLKRFLAEHVQLSLEELPWRAEVRALIEAYKSRGARIVLATATDSTVAEKISESFGLFDEVIGSDGILNLKGPNKAKVLVERYGEQGYDYIGDCSADVPVWEHAEKKYVVGRPTRKLLEQMQGGLEIITAKDSIAVTTLWRRQLRVHQWSKNLLLFVPLVLSHQIWNPLLVLTTLFAAFTFSLCASSVYLINDLLDLSADRSHTKKRFRPLAAGKIPLTEAVVAAGALSCASIIFSALITPLFLVALLIYFVTTLLYSTILKRLVVIDILVLALLYTIRVLAGGVAIGVGLSPWLLAFSLFLFLSLGAVKRYSELYQLISQGKDSAAGRGYIAADRDAVQSIGFTCGVASVVVLALYVTSPDVTELYHRPSVLLLICPLVLYWVLRVWFLALRGKMEEDPVLFAMTDTTSYLVGGIAAALLVIAT